jgi:hypothetical protein
LNDHLRTVIVAPMTTKVSWRHFELWFPMLGSEMVKRVGHLPTKTLNLTLETLQEFFAPLMLPQTISRT